MAFVIDDSVDIDAPAEVVWKVLTDFPAYGEWNPFVPGCSTTLEPGAPIDMRVRLVGPRPKAQREWIRSHTPGTEFSYAMKPIPLGALHSLRSHTLTPLDTGRCRYTSHFEIAGWLQPLVTGLMGSALRRGFGDMTTAVKQRAQQLT
ncbi:SRPBCC domain-containing protein [Nocardia mexicana]|uniref:Ribosome-associated toxin RatA of RatAB toxin-antitoxin module n=1 Tax=Nocardia mexicana TaxID=279262 RepID=A0A370H4L7_9NOCA|nr:SRPBCC domain-containing protein [Nocardia mexicana]RDI51085.1 ribosome-associated toxin RatA of RatAB toxin-antitoxin module [Nocardia mexicana]